MAKQGVEIFLEGTEKSLLAFVQNLKSQPPPASSITEIEVHRVNPVGLSGFTIRESQRSERLTVRITPRPSSLRCVPEGIVRSSRQAV